MAKLVQITFDTADPHALAAWWAERLGLTVEDHTALVQQLLDDGTVSEADVVRLDGRTAFADMAAAVDPDRVAPRMYFQRVPDQRSGEKNRLHLDVPVDQEQLDETVEEWVATGASFVRFGSHPGHRWAVMQDPEGNEFCLH